MNQWVFVGNLTRDVEVREVGDTEVVQLSVAVNSGFGDRRTTCYPRVNVWGRMGSGLKRLTRGMKVAVAGELSVTEFSKRDGSKGYALEVRADKVDIITPLNAAGGAGNPGGFSDRAGAPSSNNYVPSNPPPVNNTEDDEDDDTLPF